MNQNITPDDVLAFWFRELTPKQHFMKDDDVDALIRDRFLNLYEQLHSSSQNDFTVTPRGKFAAIIVLDQFSRNMFRGSSKAFDGDSLALELAKDLVQSGDHLAFTTSERTFIYMPFQHSEALADQDLSVELFKQLANEDNYRYALQHHAVIREFGRFPHRNKALGRTSSAAEEAHIATPGTGF